MGLMLSHLLWRIISLSNALNLTDGLDGLATVPVMLVALSFTLISYVVGNTIFSEYLELLYCSVSELSIFCGSIVGSCLVLVQYSTCKDLHGIQFIIVRRFGYKAIIVKHEIVLAIIGGLFVLETVSVIIQVVSLKLLEKNI